MTKKKAQQNKKSSLDWFSRQLLIVISKTFWNFIYQDNFAKKNCNNFCRAFLHNAIDRVLMNGIIGAVVKIDSLLRKSSLWKNDFHFRIFKREFIQMVSRIGNRWFT